MIVQGGDLRIVEPETLQEVRQFLLSHTYEKFAEGHGLHMKILDSAYGEGDLRVAEYDIEQRAGGDDVQSDEENFEVFTSPEAFPDVQAALEEKGVETLEAEISRIPQNTVEVSGKKAQQVIRILELFEDHEDVQKVFANFDIDESQLT